jgi:hypothetical protein
MTETTFEPIARFMGRVRRASATGGKSINMTIEEASELTAAMGLVLLAKLQSGAPTTIVEDVVIHGGGFK